MFCRAVSRRTRGLAPRFPLPSLHLLLFLLLLFGSIVMGLDGEKHERAQHEDFERTEDYRDPKIHHFLKTLLQQLHYDSWTPIEVRSAQRWRYNPYKISNSTAKIHTKS